ncbi:hypothetical protein H0H92_005710 [Tricholoma furcatifolium]|nr:hypothetical protein H0H92_005710 [Tricholoma furcatifolium]
MEPRKNQKRKLSALYGAQLMAAYHALKRIDRKINADDEGDDEGDAEVDDATVKGGAQAEVKRQRFSSGLKDLIGIMETRLQDHSVDVAPNYDTLVEFGIQQKSDLVPKLSNAARAIGLKSVGRNELWSSERLHHHLAPLETLFPKEVGVYFSHYYFALTVLKNQGAHKPRIDAFFNRVSAMLPTGGKSEMVLGIEQPIPVITAIDRPSVFSGYSTDPFQNTFAGYAAALAPNEISKGEFYSNASIRSASVTGSTFFVTEAVQGDLHEHLPRTVCQLYVAGKGLQRSTIRGALTDGYSWIFIILFFNKEGKGASWRRSLAIWYTMEDVHGARIPKDAEPDVIAGILAHWVERCFDNVDDEDWFTISPETV